VTLSSPGNVPASGSFWWPTEADIGTGAGDVAAPSPLSATLPKLEPADTNGTLWLIDPNALGVKVKENVHAPDGWIDVKELPDVQLAALEANAPAGDPVTGADVALPVLLITTLCGAEVTPAMTEPKFKATGEEESTGAGGAAPTPANATVPMVPPEDTNAMVWLAAPSAVGEKVKERVHDPAAKMEAMELPDVQLSPLAANGVVGAPLITEDAALPVLLMTTFSGAEVTPEETDPKLSAAGEEESTGAGAAKLR